jgi:glycosyltransferase involved in cell wall biosynthesis
MNDVKVALIDPVGSKAGLDLYDSGLMRSLFNKGVQCNVYSDYVSVDKPEFSFSLFSRGNSASIRHLIKLPFRYQRAIDHAFLSACSWVILHIFHFTKLDEWLIKRIRRKGMRVLLIIHDVESFIRPVSAMLRSRICEQLADRLVVHNDFSRNELKRVLPGIHEDKISIIPHGNYVDLSRSKIDKWSAKERAGLPENQLCVLFFGMIKPNKGLNVLLEAWKQAGSGKILLIAGRTRKLSFAEYRKFIRQELREFDVRTMIRRISNEERNILFNAADMIILPYHKVYQSGVLISAMSSGLPVIASDLEAFTEIIVPEVNGILFKKDDPASLAAAIGKMSADETLRSRIASAAIETMRSRHSWDEIAEEYVKIFL